MSRAPARLPQGTVRGWGPARLLPGSGCVLPAGAGCPDHSGCARGSWRYLLEGAWGWTVHLEEAFSIPELPVGQVCRQRGASWGGNKVLTRTGLSFWMVFHSSPQGCPISMGRGEHRGRGAPRGGEGWSRSRERVQETLAVSTNSARLRHKEVIEAFTICLTGDICFLQARRRAACRRMRYGRAGACPCLALPAWGRAGPIPTAAFDTATGRRSLCGKGKSLARQREINMRRPALTKKASVSLV